MKSLIIYSSHYGNTAYVASHFLEALKKFGAVDVFELVKNAEINNQPLAAQKVIASTRIDLEHSPVDLSGYDIICIGIPLWGSLPEPPLSSYIAKCYHLSGKDIICYLVYEGEGDKKECCAYLKETLEAKGKSRVILSTIYWRDIKNQQILTQTVRTAINKIHYPLPRQVGE